MNFTLGVSGFFLQKTQGTPPAWGGIPCLFYLLSFLGGSFLLFVDFS
jgi:hypothetical protein